VSVGIVAGIISFRGLQTYTVNPNAIPPVIQNSVTESTTPAPASVATITSEPAIVPSQTAVVHNHGSQKTFGSTRQIRPRATTAQNVLAEDRTTKEAPAPPSAVATPQFESRTTKKANTGLSPQVIAPAKSAPPKAKVIQWP
jgi:hypothetical protein